MPNINLDDAYILGETGAQVDKVTGLFTKDEDTTSGEKAFAQLNIGTAGSNRNLLDNPFFTVNQRSFTSSTGSNGVKTVDRWEINNGGGTGGIVSVTSEGYISLVTGSAYISCQEKFGKDELAGKTVTISINDDGNIYSHSFTVPARTASTQTRNFTFKTGCGCNFFVMPQTSAYGYLFQLSIWQGYSATIRAVKLELGSVSTLANDAPPDYGTELLKCMRYFLRLNVPASYQALGTGFATSTGATSILIPTPVTMRAIPSVSISGQAQIIGAAAWRVVNSMTIRGVVPNGVVVNAIPAADIVASQTYTLTLATSTAYIDLSADL